MGLEIAVFSILEILVQSKDALVAEEEKQRQQPATLLLLALGNSFRSSSVVTVSE